MLWFAIRLSGVLRLWFTWKVSCNPSAKTFNNCFTVIHTALLPLVMGNGLSSRPFLIRLQSNNTLIVRQRFFRIITHRRTWFWKIWSNFLNDYDAVSLSLAGNSSASACFFVAKNRYSRFQDLLLSRGDRFLLQNSRLSERSRPTVIPPFTCAFLPTNSFMFDQFHTRRILCWGIQRSFFFFKLSV